MVSSLSGTATPGQSGPGNEGGTLFQNWSLITKRSFVS